MGRLWWGVGVGGCGLGIRLFFFGEREAVLLVGLKGIHTAQCFMKTALIIFALKNQHPTSPL